MCVCVCACLSSREFMLCLGGPFNNFAHFWNLCARWLLLLHIAFCSKNISAFFPYSLLRFICVFHWFGVPQHTHNANNWNGIEVRFIEFTTIQYVQRYNKNNIDTRRCSIAFQSRKKNRNTQFVAASEKICCLFVCLVVVVLVLCNIQLHSILSRRSGPAQSVCDWMWQRH